MAQPTKPVRYRQHEHRRKLLGGVCGIAGFVGTTQRRGDEIIEAQLACQRHRGPDAEGAFVRGRGAIAQNRLAIIDVERGDPPITTEDGAIGVALNGEIYNFRQLRRELERDGHRFATGCDTEVIAHLAEQCGPEELARRLDGMFAFAVWDCSRDRLILGRDRFGKKPLYYWSSGDAIVFASEIKAVLMHPDVPRELDPAAIPAYLTFGYVPTPRTFFAGVRSVPPGHVLTLEPGAPPRLACYWTPERRDPRTDHSAPSLDEAGAELRRLLTEAVARRLVADVPVGALLSGGVDSSAVVATMAQLSPGRVATFTIGFDDRDGYDERRFARIVANRYATDHHEFVVRPNAVELVERLVWHHDQPFGDSSAIPTYLLGELTRSHVTVALCGDGGDELFAGYERFAAALAVAGYNAVPCPLRRLSRRALALAPGGALRGRVGNAQRFAAVAERGMPDAYLEWVSFIDEPTRRGLLQDPDLWAQRDFAEGWSATSALNPLDRVLDLNLRTYLLDDLLVKADRMSMAHGLELRSPFLDAELAAYAIRLPPKLKVGGLRLKRALKHAMRDDLPREILRRRKRGFGVPIDRWFREDLRSYVEHMLGARNARVREHLRGDAIDALLAEHASGERTRGGGLWTLLTLEVFLRREGW
ncbi:MAG: asparagine synthase (glutamine-hydrolyzing) [Solirubrobacteraceae bacterium]